VPEENGFVPEGGGLDDPLSPLKAIGPGTPDVPANPPLDPEETEVDPDSAPLEVPEWLVVSTMPPQAIKRALAASPNSHRIENARNKGHG
jgi:hypothetical protein